MGEAFENWFKTEMLPAECDDERVIVGMRLCWNAAMLHASDIANSMWLRNETFAQPDKLTVYSEDVGDKIREEVQGEI